MSNLTIQVILEGLADALRDKVQPAVADNPYATEQVRLIGIILTLTAMQVDSLAAVRVAENAEIRTVLDEAAAIVGGEFRARLFGAVTDAEPGFKISELDAEGSRLRLLLVELHAALEEVDGVDARAMDQRIWCLLRDMDERRR